MNYLKLKDFEHIMTKIHNYHTNLRAILLITQTNTLDKLNRIPNRDRTSGTQEVKQNIAPPHRFMSLIVYKVSKQEFTM